MTSGRGPQGDRPPDCPLEGTYRAKRSPGGLCVSGKQGGRWREVTFSSGLGNIAIINVILKLVVRAARHLRS